MTSLDRARPEVVAMLQARVAQLQQAGDAIRLRAAERHLADYQAFPNPAWREEARVIQVGVKKLKERLDVLG